jgi:hypothetical protein
LQSILLYMRLSLINIECYLALLSQAFFFGQITSPQMLMSVRQGLRLFRTTMTGEKIYEGVFGQFDTS